MKTGSEPRYDSKADVLYLFSSEGQIDRSVEVSPGMTVEYDAEGNVIGLEILRASHVLAKGVVASLQAKQAGIIQ